MYSEVFKCKSYHICSWGLFFCPLGQPGRECGESASHHIVLKDQNNGKHLIKPESDVHMKNQKNRLILSFFATRMVAHFSCNWGSQVGPPQKNCMGVFKQDSLIEPLSLRVFEPLSLWAFELYQGIIDKNK